MNNIPEKICELKAIEWTNKVVFEIFRNDNIEELSIGILTAMREYLDEVIKSKEE